MQTTLIDPDVAETVGIEYSDAFARDRGWESAGLLEPTDDLRIFFSNLEGSRILDVGCGWGGYVQRFVSQDLDYIGIDHSTEMVTAAQAANPDQTFSVMSYRELSFRAGRFDGLWCCCAFSGEPKHNMPTVLTGLKQVLRDGGIMMVVMPAVYESHEGMQTDDDGEPVLYHAHYELPELVMLLQAAGFTVIEKHQRYEHGAMSVLVRNEGEGQ